MDLVLVLLLTAAAMYALAAAVLSFGARWISESAETTHPDLRHLRSGQPYDPSVHHPQYSTMAHGPIQSMESIVVTGDDR